MFIILTIYKNFNRYFHFVRRLISIVLYIFSAMSILNSKYTIEAVLEQIIKKYSQGCVFILTKKMLKKFFNICILPLYFYCAL